LNPRISIVIPTYNEVENIGALLEELRSILGSSGIEDYEVIVVDDDSPDGTWRVVERISREDSRVRLIRRVGVKGLGTAIVRGLNEARGDYVVVMDADFQHPPSLIPRLLDTAVKLGADVVVASRYTRGGGFSGWGLARRVVSLGALLLAWVLVPESRGTRDPISGFFLINRKTVSLKGVKGLGYKVLLEVLALNPGVRVLEVPYIFKPRRAGSSKLGVDDLILYLVQILTVSSMARFALVGITGIPVNLGVMALALGIGASVDVASLSGIEASIAWNYIWHELWTFKTTFTGGLEGVIRRYLGYHISVALGVLTQYATMRLLYTLLGLNPLIGQLAGIILGFLVNYTLSREKVWNLPHRSGY
jgi:dolichol-phosphate mannosyltransferase